MRFIFYNLILICILFYSKTTSAQLSCSNTWQTIEFDDFEHQNFDPAIQTDNSYSSGYPSTHGAYNGDYGIYLNIINGVDSGNIIYDREFVVCENTPLKLSMWMSTRYGGAQCNMTYNILDENANVLFTWTGDIPYASYPGWEFWTSDLFISTTSTVHFQIINNVAGGQGNDFAMDDLLLEACSSDYTLAYTPACDSATAILTGDTGGEFSFSPIPTDGAIIDATTGEITNGTPGLTYGVQYTPSYLCAAITNQNITLLTSDDATFTLDATCDGGTAEITGTIGGVFTFETAPTDGATIDATTGTVTGGTAGETYFVTYTTEGICSATSTQELTVLDADDASFTMTATCDGGTAEVTGITGGIFSFDAAPTDGATIDPTTGTVTGGTPGVSYTIVYSTNNICPTANTQVLTVLDADDASFTVVPGCMGGTVVITGDTGGTFAFNPAVTDGAVIDSVTGEVTGALQNTSYFIEYTTPGICNTTSTQELLTQDDFEFSVVGECNGAIYELTINPANGSYDASTATYVLYDDMDSVLQTNTVGDNVFVIDASIFTPPMSGTAYNYVVEVTNELGCVVYNELLVESITCFIPQGISPNNDGKNDNFDLSGYDVDNLQIFNRYGIKVYSKTNYTNDWYGQSDSGDELPVGTYFYVMEYQGNKTKTSWVYLNREN
ncbi:gliding motility-associated C-terminal domain-containing protein [Lacinutrix sp. C3R15]|uniref:gliding motility-associated C-terminal domain-containing protein n=1 Tax=Flavobacteriaceae TaxID=49546 RepID=UPI001C083CD2|nr:MULTISPECIES: gliding motility-associated C-terminal domain-containing protein [Flavobacteriaceae]MBU2940289.1 gliding motility-associated C-terminal domain-containing protein [Lacinutrix sp. C3R15]MDO6623609.1 gliding motility-associated C-terminal domain-containing protein [Oceanihabitans sp. 1_MG-2023]